MKYILSKNNLNDLKEFETHFLKWQKVINLVSKSDVAHLWHRHILDSVQLFPYFQGKKILDLGSGGGFPALILAILDREEKSNIFYLAEKDERKCAFLKDVIRKFSLNAQVLNDNIEKIKPFDFNIVTSRAMADIEKILTLAYNIVDCKTEFYLMKGKNVDIEIEKAKVRYDFDFKKIQSLTDNQANIIKIFNLKKGE